MIVSDLLRLTPLSSLSLTRTLSNSGSTYDGIIAGINIDQKQYKIYLSIDWQDKSTSFLVVHRLAVKEELWNKKIGKKLMLFAEELIRERALTSIRLDTYSGNPKAILFYKKLGYKELGTIDLKPNKNKYHCFEKIIK